jgi:hypothetical protein
MKLSNKLFQNKKQLQYSNKSCIFTLKTNKQKKTIMKGKRRQENTGSFQLQVGQAEVEVLCFNPDRDALNELLGKDASDDDQEIEYLKDVEFQDGDGPKKKYKSANVTAWVKEVKEGTIFPIYFSLVDKEVISRTGKQQWINSVGDTAYAETEKELPSFFTHFTDFKTKAKKAEKQYREALVGEESLYKFLRSWTKFDIFDVDTEIVLNNKKIFKGDVKELNGLVDTEDVGTVVVSVEVRTKEVTDDNGNTEVKEYQSVNKNAFLPGSFFENMFKTTRAKMVQKHYDNLFGEYGTKNYAVWEPLRAYDSSENLAASGDTASKAPVASNDNDY